MIIFIPVAVCVAAIASECGATSFEFAAQGVHFPTLEQCLTYGEQKVRQHEGLQWGCWQLTMPEEAKK